MVKKFYPIVHDADELESIRNHMRDTVPTLEELNIPTETFKEVEKHLDKCIEESSQKQNEVINYVSQFFGKYIRIRFLYNKNIIRTLVKTEIQIQYGVVSINIMHCYINTIK